MDASKEYEDICTPIINCISGGTEGVTPLRQS